MQNSQKESEKREVIAADVAALRSAISDAAKDAFAAPFCRLFTLAGNQI